MVENSECRWQDTPDPQTGVEEVAVVDEEEAVMAAVEEVAIVMAVEETEIAGIVIETETIPEDHADLGQGPDPVQGAVPGDVIPNLEVDQRAVVVAEVVAGATTKASLNQNQDQDLQSKITHWNCVFESLLNILDNLLTPEGFFSFFEFMLPRTMISWKR